MLDLEAPLGRSSGRAAAAPPAVTLSALASAVPQHVMRQEDVVRRVKALFGDRRLDIDRLLPAFGNAGSETRRSCVPLAWYLRPSHGTDRHPLFFANPGALLAEPAERCPAAA